MILAAILALSVTASDAITAVRGWVRQGGTLEAVGMPVEAVPETTDAGNRFYAVRTTQGTVWTQGDTDYEPIIAFTAADGDFTEPDKRGPMWALLTASVEGAVYDSEALAKWQALWAKGEVRRLLLAASVTGEGKVNISDVRVAQLVRSKWGQGDGGIKGCYNYYTPSYSVCGCVATAMAQVMYYHKYPTAPVTAQTKTCSYKQNWAQYTMKGGVYDWAEMVDDPQPGITQAQRNAIGKLTYDCGVATHMQWDLDESATWDYYCNTAFCEYFGYSSATYAECGAAMTAENIGKLMLCNFDAGYPVMLGIGGVRTSDNKQAGHSIIGDGYGYNEGDLYVHLNMGWGGVCDLWYKLPDIRTKGTEPEYYFSTVFDIIYNIIPKTQVLGILSGRVLNDGQPVPGYRVKVCDKNGNQVAALITDEHGIYAFESNIGFTNYSIEAEECAEYAAYSLPVQLSLPDTRSQSWSYVLETLPRYVGDINKIGNSWGNDLTLTKNTKTDQSVTASAESAGGSSVAIPLSWFIDEGLASGTTPVSEMSAKTLEPAANGVNSVAECYVIGISPTNETAQFTADISFNEDGTVKIEHDPNLKDRTYTTKYSTNLKDWNVWDGQAREGAFFKVEVSK